MVNIPYVNLTVINKLFDMDEGKQTTRPELIHCESVIYT
jgi:hypothetical protein